jgi:hypothetical protein
LAPTHEATNDGLEYGPIDKLSFKVQGMLLLDEAEQILGPDGPAQESDLEVSNSNDAASFLD